MAQVLATWQDDIVHLWGWDGSVTMTPTVLLRAIRRSPFSPPPPLFANSLSSVSIRTPGGEALRPMSVKIDPSGAPVWLAGVDAGAGAMSDSVRWFGAVARLATAIVDRGYLAPELHGPTNDHAMAHAAWIPLPSAAIDDALASLDGAMPVIAATAAGRRATPVFETFVDAIARGRLMAEPWSPMVPRDRAPATAAAKATFKALSRIDRRVVATGGAGYDDALGGIADALVRSRIRAAGAPVVLPRVRLLVPDDRLDPWTVALELVDEADPGRWCAAADVWVANPLALEIATSEHHLDRLASTLRAAASTIAAALPVLGSFADDEQPAELELDVETAAAFLEEAPDTLQRAGIDLIGPEHLVRSRISVRGVATPAAPSDRAAGFNRDTIVKWSFTVAEADGAVAISDAELARAEAAGSTLLHTGHRWVRIDPDAIRRARRRLASYVERAEHAESLGLLRLSADAAVEGDALEEDASALTPGNFDDADRYAEWSGHLLSGLPDERLREEKESAAFVGELRHYQRRGLSWMRFLSRLGLGGCLADDMGLGKTATALAHLVDRPGRHLVVCPLSVVHNWETEAARFTPSLPVRVHHGAGRNHADDEARPVALDLVQPALTHEVTITTYGLLARDIEHLSAVDWATVVLDEAQFVKNPATKAARAVRRLRAGQRLALTGTPVENRLADLWSILDGVNPGMLGSREKFRHRYSKPIERADDPELAADAAAQLRTMTQPFVLRRTKADRQLVPDLPDKIEQIAYAGLTREQATLYQHVVDELLADASSQTGMKRRGLILAALTKLKQICNHPMNAVGDNGRIAGRSGKLTRFDELVDELVDVGERALVFTQYVDMGLLLQRHLGERFGWSVPFLHGSIGRRQRTQMIDTFQDDAAIRAGSAPLLLVSLKAGGTGLNLTAASQVIHYDRWWNPAVENQATDRAWRIGQQRTVLVHKLVCEGTVEERIDKLIADKQALADVVVGAGESFLSEMSTADLRELVRLDLAAVPGRTTEDGRSRPTSYSQSVTDDRLE